MMLFILIVIFFLLVTILYMMDSVQNYGSRKIISYKDLSCDFDVILVLGAGINGDGTPCNVLEDRLRMAMRVNKRIGNAKIILSGEHRNSHYNEVGTMKDYIMKRDIRIKECNIFLDHFGFSTYESIYRAKAIFKVKKMIIITNEYHLPRALYIANKLGIEAYGIPSDLRNYDNIAIYEEREIFAQVKDYIYANILKPKPKYLGKEIPIDKSDGRLTHYKM